MLDNLGQIYDIAKECEKITEQDMADIDFNKLQNNLTQIKTLCNTLRVTPYYIRVCKDYVFDDLNLENAQIFTEDGIKEEYLAIDYISEEDMDKLTMQDLREIAQRNNEDILTINISD